MAKAYGSHDSIWDEELAAPENFEVLKLLRFVVIVSDAALTSLLPNHLLPVFR